MSEKNSDFFNLDSSSDEDSDDEKTEAKIKEWDWDAPENYDKFYQQETDSNGAKTSTKRTIHSVEWTHDKKQKTTASEKVSIEKINDYKEYSASKESKLVYKLHGHKGSVNRIHWSNRYDTRSRLLSSSMDKYSVLFLVL